MSDDLPEDMMDRAGYVVLERQPGSSVFGGDPWPEVGEQAFFPPTDLMELDGIPRAYIAQALRWSQANPEQWQVAYYLDVTEVWDCPPPPKGWTWLGFDLGESVWNLRAGYSIIACECRPAHRLDAWWDTLNGHALMPTLEATKGLIEARAAMMSSNPEGFEPFFGSGIRIYHVAVHHVPPPWRVPNHVAVNDEVAAAASALESLSSTDRSYIDAILSSTATDVVLYEDWEFTTLFGVERGPFRSLTAQWHEVLKDPHRDRALRAGTLAVVVNALGNALGYPGAAERIPHSDQADRLLTLLRPRGLP